ncbi:hypothetical protein [Polaromonas sp.]|uniref:hypothetical protein n=1 Tax=Polaromonas sp. TaxID=1869339 RepID=UPI0032654020
MASTPKDEETLELMWAAHWKELKSMSDSDIMEGVDLPKFGTDRIQLMASIKAEAGRRRLAAAKAELGDSQSAQVRVQSSVPIAEARAFLREAANDPRVTMAARALDEMSDELVLRTYARVKALLAPDADAGDS